MRVHFQILFFSANIKTVINLQQSGEHASCGPGLEASGFSYDPQDFMDSDSELFPMNCLRKMYILANIHNIWHFFVWFIK